jgi:DNA recombination protein RmuC
VFDLGRELYERLNGLGGHVDAVGKALAGAVTAYNRAVGSLESRVLVTARKLNQLGSRTPRSTRRSPSRSPSGR